eukprot:Gb_30712 [translate_table: standard]
MSSKVNPQLRKLVYGAYKSTKPGPLEALGEQQPAEKTAFANERVLPPPQRTNICVWCSALICSFITILLILLGLAVLVVYLIFHPRLPTFEIVEARLNRISLDPTNYVMNSEIISLAKIANPNHKVDVVYEYINFKLYFHSELIATQLLEPFGQKRGNWSLNVIDMVSSDVELSPEDGGILISAASKNNVAYQLKGTFRTQARFGSIAHIPYWFYADCRLAFGIPPNGSLVSQKCRTRH